jgi:hypothetical protein
MRVPLWHRLCERCLSATPVSALLIIGGQRFNLWGTKMYRLHNLAAACVLALFSLAAGLTTQAGAATIAFEGVVTSTGYSVPVTPYTEAGVYSYRPHGLE